MNISSSRFQTTLIYMTNLGVLLGLMFVALELRQNTLDKVQFNSWLGEWVNILLGTHSQFNAGLVSEEEWAHQVADFSRALNNPYYRETFENMMNKTTFPADLLLAINQ
jgi:hypothetical protein